MFNHSNFPFLVVTQQINYLFEHFPFRLYLYKVQKEKGEKNY